MQPVRLIALDMDGTLLSGKGIISKENVNAIKKAQQAGVIVAICSGRFPENASMVIKEYDLHCPVIGTNGCAITLEPMGACVSLHEMDKKASVQAFEILDAMDAYYFLFGHKMVVTSDVNVFHHSELSKRQTELTDIRFTHGRNAVIDALEEGICKYYVTIDDKVLQKRGELEAIQNVVLTSSGPSNIEIMPKGIDKGTGILELANHYNIPMESVMAMGDQDNDLPMLTRVGYGVAMGNAPMEIKQQVRYETLHCSDHGVAHAIERFVFGKE